MRNIDHLSFDSPASAGDRYFGAGSVASEYATQVMSPGRIIAFRAYGSSDGEKSLIRNVAPVNFVEGDRISVWIGAGPSQDYQLQVRKNGSAAGSFLYSWPMSDPRNQAWNATVVVEYFGAGNLSHLSYDSPASAGNRYFGAGSLASVYATQIMEPGRIIGFHIRGSGVGEQTEIRNTYPHMIFSGDYVSVYISYAGKPAYATTVVITVNGNSLKYFKWTLGGDYRNQDWNATILVDFQTLTAPQEPV